MMNRVRPPMLALVLGAALVAVTGPAVAGEPTDQLKQRVDEVVKILSDPALKEKPDLRRRTVRTVADQIFDFPETARRSLGPHWAKRSPEEQKEFVALFTDLLERSYVSKIDLYQGEKVQLTGESIRGEDATVKTTIATSDGTEVPVDYRMHRKDGRWLVYDVVIEGVSLVSNYRTQFNKIVTTESYGALVQRLQARESAPAASPAKRARRDRD